MFHLDKIYEVGIMGCGKSTVGPVLAQLLGWTFLGLDEEIEAEQKMSISEIAAQKKMEFFRELETAKLRELQPTRNVVIACGGGAFVDPKNRNFILNDGFVVHLCVPFDVIQERLLSKPEEVAKRPLLQGSKKDAKRELKKRFDERQPAYRRAHEQIYAVGSAQEIAENIIREREKYLRTP